MTTPDILLLAAAIVPIMLARSTTSMSLPHNQTEGTRMKRLDSLLQEEVGQAIIAECDMPLGTLASVTRVETSPDV
ncbi:MAG: ribosome-binding factor A, partial [Candidatus Andersenbacteria bacterium]|nr:ribosome-binding factor A [Candidatus Andersenbacteria bacterium]